MFAMIPSLIRGEKFSALENDTEGKNKKQKTKKNKTEQVLFFF